MLQLSYVKILIFLEENINLRHFLSMFSLKVLHVL